jgi:predicted nucleotidyltransferase
MSDLDAFIIYRVVVGSRAFGLDTDESDTDRRGIYLPSADRQWSMEPVPEQLENDAEQSVYWELGKFLRLALKGDPNMLECLWSPLVEHANAIAQELLGMREIFLSKLVYQTYTGYSVSQFRRLEQDIRTRGEIKWKHPMHLIRLLLSAIIILREGRVPVRVESDFEELMAIRRGERTWAQINGWRLDLQRELDAAFATTKLPDRPDTARADAFLIRARRSMV